MKSLSKAKLKLFTSLQHKKYRYQHCMFLIEGKKMFQEAYQSNWEIAAIILRDGTDSTWMPEMNADLKEKTQLADAQSFRQLSSQTHPEGILTVVKFPHQNFCRPISSSPTLLPGPSFVLDQLQDPGNVGTIMRTLDWLGIKNLICGSGTVDVLNPKCLRASMGAIFRTNISYVSSLDSFLTQAPSQVWIADMEGRSLRDISFTKNDFIVLGNEANGVSNSIKRLSGTHFVSINGKGSAESLNVGAAGAIFAWEISKM